MRRIERHLTYANVISTLCLFLLVGGGTAMAAFVVNSNSQVARSTISGHAPPTGKHANIISESVNSEDVADNSITGADVTESTFGTVPNASKLAGIPPSALTKARATNDGCDPDTSGFDGCGELALDLARTSRVLIVASAEWFSTSGNGGAICRIRVDGTPLGPDANPGESTDTTDIVHKQGLTLTNVTVPLDSGLHTFGLFCRETSGNIHFVPTYISAASTGSG